MLFECGNAVARFPFRPVVARLWEELTEQGNLLIPTPEEIEQAWREFTQQFVGGPGMVDLISMGVMRRESIRQVFSKDRHFLDARFETLF